MYYFTHTFKAYLTFVCFINLNRIDKYKDKMIEKQTKIAAAAQASAVETLDRAKAMKGRFTTFTDKKARELTRVRQSAMKKVAAINKAHTRELERQKAQSVRDSRATSKKVVALESHLVAQQRNHENDVAAIEKQHTNEMKTIKAKMLLNLANRLRSMNMISVSYSHPITVRQGPLLKRR